MEDLARGGMASENEEAKGVEGKEKGEGKSNRTCNGGDGLTYTHRNQVLGHGPKQYAHPDDPGSTDPTAKTGSEYNRSPFFKDPLAEIMPCLSR